MVLSSFVKLGACIKLNWRLYALFFFVPLDIMSFQSPYIWRQILDGKDKAELPKIYLLGFERHRGHREEWIFHAYHLLGSHDEEAQHHDDAQD